MPRRQRKPKIELIDWVDACSSGGWQEAKNAGGLMPTQSVGRVVDETRDYVCLAGTWNGQQDVSAVISIPRGDIRRREVLARDV